MKIVTLNKNQLSEFINSDEYSAMPHIPISYHRAVSHINNPRADENDILLILIYLEFGLAGYLGIVPDLIFNNQIPEKIGWMSSIWVHSKARNQGIAKKLTQTAIDLWNNRIFATEFTPFAYALYRKMGKFSILTQKEGLRIYRRSCTSSVIPARFPKADFIKLLLFVSDFVLNCFHDLVLNKKNKIFADSITVEQLTMPDNNVISFIASFQKEELTRRKDAEINWILNFTWIKETAKPSDESRKYYFTSEVKLFKMICLKISQHNSVVGFMMLTVRNKHLKTPYLYIKNGFEFIACQVINNLMREYKIDILTSYNPVITKNISSENIHYLYSKKINRIYLKTFEIKNKDFFLQDGDGDCVFV